MSRYYRHNPDEPIRHDWITPNQPVGKLLPQPAPSFATHACIDCGEFAASGGTRCEDCQEEKELD